MLLSRFDCILILWSLVWFVLRIYGIDYCYFLILIKQSVFIHLGLSATFCFRLLPAHCHGLNRWKLSRKISWDFLSTSVDLVSRFTSFPAETVQTPELLMWFHILPAPAGDAITEVWAVQVLQVGHEKLNKTFSVFSFVIGHCCEITKNYSQLLKIKKQGNFCTVFLCSLKEDGSLWTFLDFW